MNLLATQAPAAPSPNKLIVAGSGSETEEAIAGAAVATKISANPTVVTIRSIILPSLAQIKVNPMQGLRRNA
jgi:hypothetical protein